MNHKYEFVADIVYTTNNLCKTMDSKDIAAKAWGDFSTEEMPY